MSRFIQQVPLGGGALPCQRLQLRREVRQWPPAMDRTQDLDPRSMMSTSTTSPGSLASSGRDHTERKRRMEIIKQNRSRRRDVEQLHPAWDDGACERMLEERRRQREREKAARVMTQLPPTGSPRFASTYRFESDGGGGSLPPLPSPSSTLRPMASEGGPPGPERSPWPEAPVYRYPRVQPGRPPQPAPVKPSILRPLPAPLRTPRGLGQGSVTLHHGSHSQPPPTTTTSPNSGRGPGPAAMSPRAPAPPGPAPPTTPGSTTHFSRRDLLKRQQERQARRESGAATAIQRAYRRHAARARREEIQRSRCAAAVMIQRKYRRRLCVLALERRQQRTKQMHDAAARIQAVQRGRRCRRGIQPRHAGEPEESPCATFALSRSTSIADPVALAGPEPVAVCAAACGTSDAASRALDTAPGCGAAAPADKQHDDQADTEDAAEEAEQPVVPTPSGGSHAPRPARPDTAQRQREAAEAIQRRYRQHQALAEQGRLRRQQEQEEAQRSGAAAARIQAAQRGRRCRKEIGTLHAAAARIQAVQRGRRCREEIGSLKAAAVRIQAVQRGRRCREEMEQRRAQMQGPTPPSGAPAAADDAAPDTADWDGAGVPTGWPPTGPAPRAAAARSCPSRPGPAVGGEFDSACALLQRRRDVSPLIVDLARRDVSPLIVDLARRDVSPLIVELDEPVPCFPEPYVEELELESPPAGYCSVAPRAPARGQAPRAQPGAAAAPVEEGARARSPPGQADRPPGSRELHDAATRIQKLQRGRRCRQDRLHPPYRSEQAPPERNEPSAGASEDACALVALAADEDDVDAPVTHGPGGETADDVEWVMPGEGAPAVGAEEATASSTAQGLLDLCAAHGRRRSPWPADAAAVDHPVTLESLAAFEVEGIIAEAIGQIETSRSPWPADAAAVDRPAAVDSLAAFEAHGIIAEAIRQIDISRMSSPVPVQDDEADTSRTSTPVPVEGDVPSLGAGRCAAGNAGAPGGVGILGCCMPNTDLEWTQHIEMLDDTCESELSAVAGVVAGRVIASCKGDVDLGSALQTVASDAYNTDDSEAAAAAAAQAICQRSIRSLWGPRRSLSASNTGIRSSCSSPLVPDELPGPGPPPPPPPLETKSEAVTVVDADAQGDDSDAEDNVAMSLVQQVFAHGEQDFRSVVIA